ncbi:MAG TPA: murein biosynthesis integral membrane protein MurJ [Candidatus Acidoferrales bacterium]|nr:murein biosynthesis integral membrane protein MurJ [Candidatus Acidoferrales bacterium]
MTSRSFNRTIIQSTGIVMASVLLSRLLGFAREWTVAHQIGSNAITDTYYAAFTLPDFLNYLVAGGSLSITFIPVFAKFAAENREEEAWRVFSTVMTFMGLLVIGMICLAEVFAPQLVSAIAPGFGPAEKQRVVFLTRLMLPAQFCFYEGGILTAVQYAKGKFIVPSLAPLIYNFAIILGGVLLASRIGITGFAVGVLVGAAMGNFLLQIYGAHLVGARFSFALDLRHPGFKLFLKLAIPIMLALSLSFTDDWIIRWFGSYLVPASITWLTYAKTLMRVPLGVVGQAIGVASFPVLAQLYSEGKFTELNRVLNDTFKGLILLLVPISALTIAQSPYVVYLVFSHTRLHTSDLQATAATLALFSIGMFAWGAQNLVARAFYSTRDTWTPALVGTAFTIVDIPLYWWLVRREQHLGLAMASSLGIILFTIVLWILLDRRTHNRETKDLLVFFSKIAAASALSAAAVFEFARWLSHFIVWQRMLGSLEVLALGTIAGVVLLLILLKLFRTRELDAYLAKLPVHF